MPDLRHSFVNECPRGCVRDKRSAFHSSTGEFHMTTHTLQDQLAPVAAQVITRDAFFNPITFIDEQVSEERLRHALASNVVWALDTSAVSLATAMYFEIARENPGNDIGKLIDIFKGQYDHEGFWGEGNARGLVAILSLQPTAHELAVRTAMAIGYLNYQPRAIDELVANQSAFKIRGQELSNLHVAAEFIVSQGDSDLSVEEVEKMLIDQRTMRNEDLAKMRRGLLPAVRVFIEEARKNKIEDASFTDLPLTTRLFVTRMQRDAIPRIITDMAPRVDTSQFMAILVEANATKKTYARVVDHLSRELEQQRTNT
jgi:hypothetical protein